MRFFTEEEFCSRKEEILSCQKDAIAIEIAIEIAIAIAIAIIVIIMIVVVVDVVVSVDIQALYKIVKVKVFGVWIVSASLKVHVILQSEDVPLESFLYSNY